MFADSSSAQPLDRAAVAAVDPTDQIADVLSLPEQLRDAVFKVESAELPQVDSPGGLLVAGMGGSGIGGRLARGILGDQASRPILSSAGYSLPGWTTSETTVLCASYSGETEETLACFEAAGIIGTNRVVVTTGGSLAQAARAEGVPVRSILASAAVTLVAVLMNYLIPQHALELLMSLVVATLVINWAMISFSHFKFRQHMNRTGQVPLFKALWYPYGNYICLAFVAFILGVMLLIPGIQISVYAIPVWVVFMWVCYVIKNKRGAQQAVHAAGAAK